MKAVVFTLGCKVNSRESACIMQGLKERGYEVFDEFTAADLYVINTCAVTAEAEKKSRQAIARAKRYSENAKIIICGCAAQNHPQAFCDKGAFAVVGAQNKERLFDLLDIGGVDISGGEGRDLGGYLPCKTSKTREYIKIQDGCDNFCSYCIIPYLRGRSRSRDKQKIKQEILHLSPQEAVITGINVSDYNFEGCDLADLLLYLSDLDCRIRIGSLEACVITERFLKATKALKNFAPHFHLSLQSGSNAVLKSMNRHYTAEEYAAKVDLIRSYYPSAAITTDVIVGYSTETDEFFEQSYEFCKKIRFADIHCFPYSVRKGTAGAKLKPIADEVKKQRLNKLLGLKAELKAAYEKQNEGNILQFIAEEQIDGYAAGYSENYLRLYVKGGGLGVYNVRVLGSFKDGALAEEV